MPGLPALAVHGDLAGVLALRQRKPVVAVVNPFAASAAYHIASQATEVVVVPSGQVGSIGTFVMHVDTSAALEMAGLKVTLISAGKHKVAGNEFEPLDSETEAAIQRDVNTFNDVFVRDVARGRGVPQARVRGTSFGEGRMVLARQAQRAGLVDRVATVEQVVFVGDSGSPAQASTPGALSLRRKRLRLWDTSRQT